MTSLFKKIYKIAILAPTPFYYHVPLYQIYQKLAKAPEIELRVFYCSDETLRGQEVEKLYQSKGKIVGKEELLKGYNFKFLKNYSPFPSYLHWPFGLINLGIWREIKEGKYDALILQSWTNLTWWLAFFAALKFKVPVLFMTDSNVFSEFFKNPGKRYLKKLFLGNFLFKKVAGFLTSGKANERFYEIYGVSKEKMVRLPFSWGYEELLLKAKKLRPKRENLRRFFGLKKEDFVLLFVGRLSKEKKPLFLLEAYQRVSYPQKKIFFVGNGPLSSQLEKKVKVEKIEGVSFFGFQPRKKIAKFYTLADALCLPSEDETWGMVVSEAMCFALPLIVSDRVGATLDLVKEGENGFLFKANEREELTTCIEKLIRLSKKERLLFGKRSQEIISQWTKNFNPLKQMLKMLKIISQNAQKN